MILNNSKHIFNILVITFISMITRLLGWGWVGGWKWLTLHFSYSITEWKSVISLIHKWRITWNRSNTSLVMLIIYTFEIIDDPFKTNFKNNEYNMLVPNILRLLRFCFLTRKDVPTVTLLSLLTDEPQKHIDVIWKVYCSYQ